MPNAPFFTRLRLKQIVRQRLSDIDQRIAAAAEADFIRMLEGVQTLLFVNAPEELLIAVRLPHEIQAGLIQRDRIRGGQNADVVDIGLLGIRAFSPVCIF